MKVARRGIIRYSDDWDPFINLETRNKETDSRAESVSVKKCWTNSAANPTGPFSILDPPDQEIGNSHVV